jgi:hypothetical protein
MDYTKFEETLKEVYVREQTFSNEVVFCTANLGGLGPKVWIKKKGEKDERLAD